MGRQILVHKCQCVSMNPGMQIMPRASMDAAGELILSATATITPLRTCTSARAKSPIPAFMESTVAPRMTNSPRLGKGFVPAVDLGPPASGARLPKKRAGHQAGCGKCQSRFEYCPAVNFWLAHPAPPRNGNLMESIHGPRNPVNKRRDAAGRAGDDALSNSDFELRHAPIQFCCRCRKYLRRDRIGTA